MNYTHYKNLLQSKVSNRTVFYSLGALVVALLIFQAGIFVGYRKASFSYRSGDNFHRIFGSPEREGMMGFMDKRGWFGSSHREFTSGYGANGIIVKIDLPTIIVTGVDNVEKVVVINETTIVRSFRNDIKATDLKVGDAIIVMGSPNTNAQIEAKLIRVMPSQKTVPGLNATSTIKQ